MTDKASVTELYGKMSEIGMNGWISIQEGEILRSEIERLEPGQSYLEIGVAYGKSIATMGYYAKDGISIAGIDRTNWEERDKSLMKLSLYGRVNFIEGDSQEESLRWDKPIDLLFLDADHSYYGIVADLLSWLPLVRPGGRILLHDYDITSPGVMKAVHNFIYPHKAYENYVIPREPGVSLFRCNKKII